MGYSKLVAQMAVFLLSAFFHEVLILSPFNINYHAIYSIYIIQYLISIPLQMLRPWAFTAMLAQVCDLICTCGHTYLYYDCYISASIGYINIYDYVSRSGW